MNDSCTNRVAPTDPDLGFSFVAEPEHTVVIGVYSYWRKQAGDREMPEYSDIDPIHIPKLMPNVMIGEIVDREKMSVRVRLFGTALVYVTGEDRTGMVLEEARFGDIENPERQAIIDRWRLILLKCASERRPVFTTRAHSNPRREFLTTHTATMPLLGPSGDIERFISAMATVSASGDKPTGVL